jgi:hypothetical protein
MTLKQAIERYRQYINFCEYQGLAVQKEELEQMTAWLRELQERRKEPEIVRCGECKHNGTHNCLLNLWATIFNSKPKDDFYCGMAERRTDADD